MCCFSISCHCWGTCWHCCCYRRSCLTSMCCQR